MGLLSTPLGRLAGAAAVTAGGIALLGSSSSSSTATAATPTALKSFSMLLSSSVFVGSNVWTTFFAGIVMFKNMDRTSFGNIQAKLFPAYFLLQTVSSSLMTVLAATGAVAGGGAGGGGGDKGRSLAITSGSALALSLLNLAVLEPLTTAAMYKRRAAESGGDDAEKKKANKKFGMLHGFSSLSNLLALGSGLTAVWFLSEGMK